MANQMEKWKNVNDKSQRENAFSTRIKIKVIGPTQILVKRLLMMNSCRPNVGKPKQSSI